MEMRNDAGGEGDDDKGRDRFVPCRPGRTNASP